MPFLVYYITHLQGKSVKFEATINLSLLQKIYYQQEKRQPIQDKMSCHSN